MVFSAVASDHRSGQLSLTSLGQPRDIEHERQLLDKVFKKKHRVPKTLYAQYDDNDVRKAHTKWIVYESGGSWIGLSDREIRHELAYQAYALLTINRQAYIPQKPGSRSDWLELIKQLLKTKITQMHDAIPEDEIDFRHMLDTSQSECLLLNKIVAEIDRVFSSYLMLNLADQNPPRSHLVLCKEDVLKVSSEMFSLLPGGRHEAFIQAHYPCPVSSDPPSDSSNEGSSGARTPPTDALADQLAAIGISSEESPGAALQNTSATKSPAPATR